MAMSFRFVYYTSALIVLEKSHSVCPFVTKLTKKKVRRITIKL